MTIAMSDAAADDAAFLKAVSEALRSNVEIKDRRVRLRTQQLCFVGAEAVTFLVTAGHAPTREAAVALGQRLLCNQFLRKLSNSDGEFLDSNLLYRFAEDEAAPIRKASPALGGPFRPTRRSSKFSHATTSSSIEGSSSGSKPRFHSSYRSAGSYDHSTYCHEDEVAQGIRTQSLIDEQRAARLRKSSFCPIESILTVAPVSTVGFTDTCSFYFSPHTTHNSIALTVPIVTAMKAAFSSRNLHARETAVHHLRNQVLKAADPSDKSWMYLKNITGHHGNDVRVFCKTSGGGFQTVLTVGPVHVAPSTFVTHFLDSNERKKMDALFETSQTVEDLLMAHRRDKMHVKNHFHEVFSTAAAAPWMDPEHPMPDEVHWAVQPSERMADMFPEQQQQPHAPHHDMSGLKTDGGVQRILYRTMAPPSAVLSARDFVTFQDCFSMDNGAHCVYEISVEHRDIPSKMERYTRGEVLCLAHIAEPIPGNPNASMLTVVTQVGLKGKLPAFIANLIFEKLISRSFDAQTCGLVVDCASHMRSSLRDVPFDRQVPDDIVQRISSGGAMPANKDGNKVGLQDFELLAVLGRGGFAKVMQVRHKQTRKVHAMKILKKEELVHDIQIERTRTERSILAAVDHPFIVALSYAFQDTKRLFMVMDFVQGGDLFAHLRKYGAVPVPRARLYLAEIALAVSHLHALDIVYRDLKPENVLIDADGHLKITDFGLSHFFDPPDYDDESDVQAAPSCASSSIRSNSLCQVTHSFCGTEAYMAPEMLLHLGHGKPIDWWCLGIVACEMLTGVHPFRGDSHMRLLSNVVNRDPILPPHLPPDAASLIQGLLCKQPRLRLGSVGRKFVEIQDHPFFAGLDWAKVEAKGYPMEFMPPIESDFDVSNFGSQYTSEKFSGANSSACATSDASSQPPMEHPTQSSQRSGPSSDDHNNSYVVRCSQQSSDTTHGSQYRKFSGFSFAGPPDVEGSGC